jgi:hypothetical protein
MSVLQRQTAVAGVCAALACLAGCSSEQRLGAASHFPEAAARVCSGLLAGDDIAPDLVPHIIRPESDAVPAGPATRGRVNRIGVRGAYLVAPATAQGEWGSSFVSGAYVRYEEGPVFEFAVDYAKLAGAYENSAGATSEIVFGRFDILFSGWGRSNDGVRFYLLTGAAVGVETATWVASDDTLTRTAGMVDIGFGLGAWNGTWDVRATYALPGADFNAQGFASLGVGFAF